MGRENIVGGKYVLLVIIVKRGRDKTAEQGAFYTRLTAAFAIVIRKMIIPANREPRRDPSNHQGGKMKNQKWDTTSAKPAGHFMKECLKRDDKRNRLALARQTRLEISKITEEIEDRDTDGEEQSHSQEIGDEGSKRHNSKDEEIEENSET